MNSSPIFLIRSANSKTPPKFVQRGSWYLSGRAAPSKPKRTFRAGGAPLRKDRHPGWPALCAGWRILERDKTSRVAYGLSGGFLQRLGHSCRKVRDTRHARRDCDKLVYALAT